MKFYFDQFQLIVTKDGDGGDTLQRIGFYQTICRARSRLGLLNSNYAMSLRSDYLNQLSACTKMVPGKGLQFIRHPLQWSSYQDCSRDQITPNICALALAGESRYLSNNFEGKSKAQNGDLIGPDLCGVIRRGIYGTSSWLGDLHLYFGVELRKYYAKNMDNVGDDLNLIAMLLVCAIEKPSWLIAKAWKNYLKRAPSFGSYLDQIRKDPMAKSMMLKLQFDRLQDYIVRYPKTFTEECDPIVGAVRWYFREEAGGNEGFEDMIEPVIKFMREKYS